MLWKTIGGEGRIRKDDKGEFSNFFGHVDNPKLIVEASSTTNLVANMFES